MEDLKLAAFLLLALAQALLLREYVKALVADRLGDPSPRRWGRLTVNPKALADPFGTVILPGLILILWAAGAPFRPPPFAYGKPMPLDPGYLKHRDRDRTIIALAGPGANLATAAVAGVALRVGFTGDSYILAWAFLYVNLIMFVFHLMPIPGLDGARILSRFLPPRAREVYANLDQYLVLFMLLVFFLLGGPLLAIVDGLTRGACSLLAGAGTCG